MQRAATVQLDVEASSPATLILSMGVADVTASDQITITQSGTPLLPRVVLDQHGARLHVVDIESGPAQVLYSVTKFGAMPDVDRPPIDEIRYLRPSRYCESDTLGAVARVEFQGLVGRELLAGVSSWVGQSLAYVPGSSQPTDGAVATLLSRRGVCRDYAHLVIAFLRALDVPARLVSVYAPGLDPMDFHAVAEAYVEGDWYVVDATTLAPRRTLMRIATGRDASDTAFLSTRRGAVTLSNLEVSAVSDVLPDDDLFELVRLG
ncbi:transglutaminase family protein [soil metagenome]